MNLIINGDFTNKLDGGLVHRGIYKIGEHFVSGIKESDCLVVFLTDGLFPGRIGGIFNQTRNSKGVDV